MRKTMLAALLLGGLGVVAPPAYAASSFAGGCYGVDTNANRVYVVGAVAVYTTPAKLNPITANVRCSYVLNGVTLATGPWVVAAPTATSSFYVPSEPDSFDDAEVCTTVDYVSTSDPTVTTCLPVVSADKAAEPTALLDPFVCATLASLAPGVAGVVDIDSEGDVAVVGTRIWDCPPYGS